MLNQYLYRRNLPHWIPRNATIFVTWRLYGSLPQSCLDRLDALSLKLKNTPKPANVDSIDWELRKRKKLFAELDAMLDQATDGPMWLKIPEIADIVQETFINKYASFYKLWSYSVMSNHCHALLKPKLTDLSNERSDPIAFAQITKRLKGYTALEANKILGRTGLTFWQDESFDHWIRNQQEFDRVVSYIENNPVKAGLVQRAEDWQWSSASERVRRGWDCVKSLT
jgi:REP element-mobilizing transposase RayT